MKRIANRLTALALAGVLSLGLSAGASAAPDGISVQLDGKALTFTDAVPEVRDSRTFLPFRAVFEAMGAKVGYDEATQAVAAQRDGTTVTMTLGGNTATVVRNGVTSEVFMDVAPYAHDNRTYVPVRFAAQALGCAVGWDQDDQTVILVDAEPLAQKVLADYQFTYLEKFIQYYEQFQKGGWSVKGSFGGEMALMAVPITLDGTVDGIMKDGLQARMGMDLKMDMLQVSKTMAAVNQRALTAEDEAMLASLKKDGVSMDIRGDMGAGKLYMKMDGGAGMMERSGLSGDTWYLMDMSESLAAGGMDLTELMDLSEMIDVRRVLAAAAANVALADKDTALADVTANARAAADVFCDEAFVKSGNDYTAQLLNVWDGDTTGSASLTLTMKSGQVVGWALNADLSAIQVAEDGTQATTTAAVAMSMDAKNHCEAKITANLAEALTVDLAMEMDYATTSKTPETEPPANAKVESYYDLMLRSMAAVTPDCPTCPAA